MIGWPATAEALGGRVAGSGRYPGQYGTFSYWYCPI